MTDTNINLFGEKMESDVPKQRKTSTKKQSLNCRDKLLAEYKENGFEPSSKLKKYEDGTGSFLPLNEKIRMFRVDFPDGEITTEVVVDNNVMAVVKVTITCDSKGKGKTVAFGKWYHTNNDSYGMNYLQTAQSQALSGALRFLGYVAGGEENEPDPNTNKGDISEMPMPFLFDENQLPVAQMPQTQQLPAKKKPEELTFEQACKTVLNTYPFVGKKIEDILNSGENIVALIEMLEFQLEQGMALAPVAKAVLPKIRKE